jgi:hypothetical protein
MKMNDAGLSASILGYMLDSVPSDYISDINEAISQVRKYNAASLKFIGELKSIINTVPLPSYASMDVTEVQLEGSVGYDTLSRVIIKFLNNGNIPIKNLRFFIPSTPYLKFQYDDSSQVLANLPVGKSAGFAFTFLSGNIDTTETFKVYITSDVGVSDTLTGYIRVEKSASDSTNVTIKAGNWNDPTVWSTGLVPTAVSAVVIRHNVVIDIDATIKSIKVESPTQVQVAAGKKLTVLQ